MTIANERERRAFEAAERARLCPEDPAEPEDEEQEPGFGDFTPEIDAPEVFG